MEDAAQQVVPQADGAGGDVLDALGEAAQRLRRVGAGGQHQQRRDRRLEHGAVVDGEDGAPGVAVGLRGRRGGGAGGGRGGRPLAVPARRPARRQVLLHAVVEEHRGGDDEQAALGGGAGLVVLAAPVAFGQVEGARDGGAGGAREAGDGPVERAGQRLRRAVGVADGVGRAAHGVGEGADAALAPLGVRPGPRPQRPREGRVAQAGDRRTAGVADGERESGQPLPQPRVRLADGLTALGRVAGLGFEDDAHALDVGGHVHALAALAHLGIGGDIVLAQQPRQLAVQQVLVLAGHAAPRRAASRRGHKATPHGPGTQVLRSRARLVGRSGAA